MTTFHTGTLEKRTLLASAVPVLPARDLPLSVRFYERVLDLRVRHQASDYAVLSLSGLELHLWSCQDDHVCHNSSCRINVRGIDELYERCRALKIIHPNAPLAEKPWGSREFAVLDPSGVLITFVERLVALDPRD